MTFAAKKAFDNFCNKLDEIETSILFCERFDERSDIWNFKKHTHDCTELLYFLYGNAELQVSDGTVDATFYDIVIYPPGVAHTECLQYNQHQEIICIWADIPIVELKEVVRIQDKDAKIKELLESLHEEYKQEHTSQPIIEHYFKLATMLIARKYFENAEHQDSLSRVVMYLQDHMIEPVTVEEAANVIHVSKSYLNRLFNKKLGMSPMEYLRYIRIETAKKMLASSDSRVEEIACLVGYDSSKSFYKAFRRYAGISPREFRYMEQN